MPKKRKNRTFAEMLYKTNVLPHGNGKGPDYIGPVLKKIEDPPFDDDDGNK